MTWLQVALGLGFFSYVMGTCSISFAFQRICKHYRYISDGGECYMGLEHLCKPLKVTFQNPNCPTTYCVSCFKGLTSCFVFR